MMKSNKTASRDASWTDVAIVLTIAASLSFTSVHLFMFLKRKLFEQDHSGSGEDPGKAIDKRLSKILRKRGLRLSEMPLLSSHERQIAADIVDPDDIDISFKDVGGLDETKREIYELAVMPLLMPYLFIGKLAQPCRGMLFYGKPGTGKTMLAKALAKESKSIFLPLQLSTILNKYWGESNKLIAATFSLANKLQPAIIFVDELDTFLRNTSEQTAYLDSIKAEFLTLWDGIGTSTNSRILVLGATNKPSNIDSAILRRMPRAFEIPLPNKEGRLAILRLLTDDENLEPSTRANLGIIADLTIGYSGSDLKEVCRAAAMVCIREKVSEFARQRVMGEDTRITFTSLEEAFTSLEEAFTSLEEAQKVRPICENDFMIALEKVKRSGEAAHQYGRSQARAGRTNSTESATSIDGTTLLNFLALLQRASSVPAGDDGDVDSKSDT